MKNIALITGATGGLGQEFVKLHAQRKGDLVLVAREQEALNKLKEKVEKEYGVEAYTIAIDLSQPDAAERIYNEMKEKGIAIDYLLNNAGFGGQGDFFTRTMEQDMSMIAVNVVTLTKLTKLFLPDMIKRGSGRVLNTSSTAAMMPGPRQAVYYATKAFVTSMGNSIWQELKGTGVTLTTLMPGAMSTGFAKAGGLQNTPLFAHPVEPAAVAKAGYEGMLKGKLNVVSGLTFVQRIFMSMAPLLPKKMMLKQVYDMQTIKK